MDSRFRRWFLARHILDDEDNDLIRPYQIG